MLSRISLVFAELMIAAAAFAVARLTPPACALDGDAVAIVNGRPISEARVVELLMESHGVEALQQLVVLELSKQEAKRRGVKVTDADVQAEFHKALDRIGREAGLTGEERTEANKLAALKVLLDEKRISMAECMISMERNAWLRKCVEGDFELHDATLREEFARTHGEKVLVRHIQVAANDLDTLGRARGMLDAGVDFAEVARRVSQNPETASRGGEMAPFTFDDRRIPATLREAAFLLKPGEVSPAIRVGQRFHILKLVRRISPENVRFEEVREQVAARLRERVLPELMSRLVQELFQDAKIKVLDRDLKRNYEEFLKERTRSPTGAGP